MLILKFINLPCKTFSHKYIFNIVNLSQPKKQIVFLTSILKTIVNTLFKKKIEKTQNINCFFFSLDYSYKNFLRIVH